MVDTEKELREELSTWKAQYDLVKRQLKRPAPVTSEISVQTTCSHFSPSKTLSPPLAELTRKNSKDRKSRPRSGDDPTATKRRRSCYDVFSENDRPPVGPRLKNARSAGDLKLGACHLSPQKFDDGLRGYKNKDDVESATFVLDEQDKENRHVAAMRQELVNIKAENAQLKERLNQCAMEKDVCTETNQGEQHMLLERMNRLDSEAGILRMENETLRARIRQQKVHDDSGSESGSSGQLTEMEECLENLREQLEAKEAAERQLRERLRLVESCAEEAEAAEMVARERFEGLLAREAENSRQVRQMQQTCRELKDILLDKEIMEQGLTDKVHTTRGMACSPSSAAIVGFIISLINTRTPCSHCLTVLVELTL